MTTAFINKIIRLGTVDTRNYRYIYKESTGKIIRCPLEMVGTTLMLDPDNFTTVYSC